MSTFTFTGNKDPAEVINTMIVSDGDKKRCKIILSAIRRRLLSPVVKCVGTAMIPY